MRRRSLPNALISPSAPELLQRTMVNKCFIGQLTFFCHVKCHHFIFLSALIFICENFITVGEWKSWDLFFFKKKQLLYRVTVTFWTPSSDRLIVESGRRCVKYLGIILKRPLKQSVHKIHRDDETSTPKDFLFYSGKCKFWRRSGMQNKSLKTQHWFWIDKVCKWVTNERKIMTLSALSGRLQGEEKVTYR